MTPQILHVSILYIVLLGSIGSRDYSGPLYKETEISFSYCISNKPLQCQGLTWHWKFLVYFLKLKSIEQEITNTRYEYQIWQRLIYFCCTLCDHPPEHWTPMETEQGQGRSAKSGYRAHCSSCAYQRKHNSRPGPQYGRTGGSNEDVWGDSPMGEERTALSIGHGVGSHQVKTLALRDGKREVEASQRF